MKKILIIAYYYPPKGGIGVQRTIKYVKYLCRLGYDVHILTVNTDQSGTLVDDSLGAEDLNIKVHRTYIREDHLADRVISLASRNKAAVSAKENKIDNRNKKINIKALLLRMGKRVFLSIYNLIYIPDAQKGWIKYAVEEARNVIRDNNIDILYTTSSPYTSHLIGNKLWKEFRIKWIADFRDPWVSNSFANYNVLTRRINSFHEKKVVLNADRVISVSQPIIDDFLLRYPDQNKNKFIMITNGYDEEDFNHLDLNMSDGNSKYTILYNGTLYGNESPDNFFNAVHKLIESGRIEKDKLKIRFIGSMGSKQKEVFIHYQNMYPEVFERSEYVTHSESLTELCKANALLLLISDSPGNERIYTGKLFEYLRTGKPVLGIVSEGVAKDLIAAAKAGYIAFPSNIDEIQKIVLAAYTNFREGKTLNPDWNIINKYSRGNLTKMLDKVIRDI